MSNHFWRGKAVSIAYSENVYVALGAQCEMCMRHIMLSSVAFPAVPYFCTLLKNNINRKNFPEHKMCVLSFHEILSEIFFIVKIIQ